MPLKPTDPSIGFLQKLFGGKLSPNVQQSWEKMQREYPAETRATSGISEMGPIGRFLNKERYAATTPWGSISVNPDLINRDNEDIDQTLTHELAHVKQMKPFGILQNIYSIMADRDQLEQAAYKEEENRRKRMLGFRKDVRLPVEK